MSLRTVLLRVLFASLALAACFGALGVLLGTYDSMWRVAGTSIATAFASLLLLAVSAKMDKPTVRSAALLAFTLVVVEYLLALGAVWDVDALLGSNRWGDSLWLAVLFIALVGVPAVVFMRLTQVKMTALAGRVGLALAAVELSLLLLVAWMPSRWVRDSVTEELAEWLPLFAMLALVCLVGIGAKLRDAWRWMGVVAAAAGYAIVVYATIRGIHDGGNVVTYIVCVAAAIAHANIVLLCSVRPGQMWLRWLTLAAGVGAALFVATAARIGPEYGDVFQRMSGATAILAGCGTLALLVLARLNRRVVVSGNPMIGLTQITVFCPVCRKKQAIPLGPSHCAECHVSIHVRVEEPRCEVCGYSLLMLRSDKCPECGTAIPSDGPVLPQPLEAGEGV